MSKITQNKSLVKEEINGAKPQTESLEDILAKIEEERENSVFKLKPAELEKFAKNLFKK